jgi:hypothetical protein
MRVRMGDTESLLPWIRNKHPGSATLENILQLNTYVLVL